VVFYHKKVVVWNKSPLDKHGHLLEAQSALQISYAVNANL